MLYDLYYVYYYFECSCKVWTMLDNAGCSKYGNFSQTRRVEDPSWPRQSKSGHLTRGRGLTLFSLFSLCSFFAMVPCLVVPVLAFVAWLLYCINPDLLSGIVLITPPCHTRSWSLWWVDQYPHNKLGTGSFFPLSWPRTKRSKSSHTFLIWLASISAFAVRPMGVAEKPRKAGFEVIMTGLKQVYPHPFFDRTWATHL